MFSCFCSPAGTLVQRPPLLFTSTAFLCLLRHGELQQHGYGKGALSLATQEGVRSTGDLSRKKEGTEDTEVQWMYRGGHFLGPYGSC